MNILVTGGAGYIGSHTADTIEKFGVPLSMTRRPGDPVVLVADSQAAKELLSWMPKQSSLREIVESAWLWHSRTHKMKAKVTL